MKSPKVTMIVVKLSLLSALRRNPQYLTKNKMRHYASRLSEMGFYARL